MGEITTNAVTEAAASMGVITSTKQCEKETRRKSQLNKYPEDNR